MTHFLLSPVDVGCVWIQRASDESTQAQGSEDCHMREKSERAHQFSKKAMLYRSPRQVVNSGGGDGDMPAKGFVCILRPCSERHPPKSCQSSFGIGSLLSNIIDLQYGHDRKLYS